MLAGIAAPDFARADVATVDIEMRSDIDGTRVWFDPIGVLVSPGTTITWTTRENVHTATAYHPANDDHSLRIPEGAAPWDSGYLVNPGDRFQVVLDIPGVYDYFCAPHEFGGMVGRIIVTEPTGPGALPFDYFKRLDPVPDWQDVPDMARQSFPSVQRILQEGKVRL